MLHYVHQLVANFVCLLSGAGQVVYKAFSIETSSCCCWKGVDKSGETEPKQLETVKPKQ